MQPFAPLPAPDSPAAAWQQSASPWAMFHRTRTSPQSRHPERSHLPHACANIPVGAASGRELFISPASSLFQGAALVRKARGRRPLLPLLGEDFAVLIQEPRNAVDCIERFGQACN